MANYRPNFLDIFVPSPPTPSSLQLHPCGALPSKKKAQLLGDHPSLCCWDSHSGPALGLVICRPASASSSHTLLEKGCI